MQCVSTAELAVLLYLHPFGMSLLILCRVIITVLHSVHASVTLVLIVSSIHGRNRNTLKKGLPP